MQKLYAYVDETGQDTQGQFFLVSVVITGEEREELRIRLREIEAQSGKGKKRWVRATLKQKQRKIVCGQTLSGDHKQRNYSGSLRAKEKAQRGIIRLGFSKPSWLEGTTYLTIW